MKPELFICACIFLLLWGSPSFAQSYQPPKKSEPIDVPAKNVFYVELLGAGGAYSLNYERVLLMGPPFSIRGRLGVSFFGGGFSFPLHIGSSYSLGGPLELEWGGGATLIPAFGKGNFHYEWMGLLGIRYESGLGLLLRPAYTPFFRGGKNGGIKHWGGLSIGLLF